MKLSRLAVNELRQFSSRFELLEFEDGLNLISGANETGKSALVRALQAVFFERYSTRSVDDLRPWQDSGAAPEVQVDFEHGGKRYQLLKRFLKKPQCSLSLGSERYEGDHAESLLQKLLGFSYPGKGASKEEYWGIPGLLWITQGTGQDLARPIAHAHDFLRETLSQGLEEISTSGGDSLINEVARDRGLLLTQTGKPTGELKKVAADVELARQELAEVDCKMAQYQHAVDRLASVRREYEQNENDRPWEQADRKKATAQAQLQDVNQQRQALSRNETELKRIRSEQQLLLEQLRQWQQDKDQLASRSAQIEALRSRLAETQKLSASVAGQLEEAATALRKAESSLKLAEAGRRRSELQATLKEAGKAVESTRTQLKRAREEQARLIPLRRQIAESQIDSTRVEALVRAEAVARELAVRRDAVATRIRYSLEAGSSLTLGEQELRGEGQSILAEAATLLLPGVGHLTIEPGGEDLSALAARSRRAQQHLENCLAELKVGSVAQARHRLDERSEAEQQLRWLERVLEDLAPEGVDKLAAELEAREARLRETKSRLDAIAEYDACPDSMDKASDALALARQQQESLSTKRQQARDEEVAARTELQSAEAEHRELKARVDDLTRQQKHQANQDRLLELGAYIARLEEKNRQQRSVIEAASPQMLEDDIQRFGRAAETTRAAQRDRLTEVARLEGELSAGGAAGLGETRAEQSAKVERMERHLVALERKAAALDLLYKRLQLKRTQLVERLQAPLQKHVAGYLRLLFPEAELKISEAFQPGKLSRNGVPEVDFGALSFGAREQVGVILRLAYADALKEAGRPTLIVLDDALVHSDKERRDAMQRVLYNAGHRHQILLFTCHPDNWAELGVPVRALEKLKAEAGL